ncbi:MAG: 30S ribosome-binding factor RbfA [Parachlamydiales bacterium]|jgi:ribosome-binding factor A
MKPKRVDRLNSLLREVISEVIHQDLRNPKISKLSTVISVEITPDLKYAKVFVSVIGPEKEKQETIKALNQAAGFISVNCSKKIVIRYFPTLSFELDTTIDKFMKIDEILSDVNKEKENRKKSKDE